MVDQKIKEQAYQAWLGFYAVLAKRMQIAPAQLVEMANTYAMEILRYKGDQTPPILAKTVGMMGLKGVPGFNLVKSNDQLKRIR